MTSLGEGERDIWSATFRLWSLGPVAWRAIERDVSGIYEEKKTIRPAGRTSHKRIILMDVETLTRCENGPEDWRLLTKGECSRMGWAIRRLCPILLLRWKASALKRKRSILIGGIRRAAAGLDLCLSSSALQGGGRASHRTTHADARRCRYRSGSGRTGIRIDKYDWRSGC